MLNQLVLVGRFMGLDDDIMEVALPKGANSTEQETYSIIVGENISKAVFENLKEGDMIGIKGRLTKVGGFQFVKCEKLTFLSSNKNH